MTSHRSVFLACSTWLLVLAGWTVPSAFAQELRTTEHQVLSEADLSSPPRAYGRFGDSLAIEGDTLIIGDPFAWLNGIASGVAHVYTYGAEGWTPEASLVPEDARSGQRFGYEVDIEGDLAFVGSPDDYELFAQAGAVYVFERTGSTWQQVQKIYDNEPGTRRWFGTTIAVDGDHLLISGANALDGLYWTNEIHSFERIAGSFVFRDAFEYSGPLPNLIGSFGNPLTADGGTAASYYYGGGVQFFERSGSTWNASQTLQPTGLVEDLVLVGDLCVGSYASPSGVPNVDVYRRTGSLWGLETRLTPSRNSPSRNYGHSVATDGTVIAVGTGIYSFPNAEPGEVTVFRNVDGEWIESVILQAAQGDAFEYLGKELALVLKPATFGPQSIFERKATARF